LIGCHVGIKGGFVGAANEAARLGCGCMQIFVSQPRRWPNTPGKTDSQAAKAKGAHVIPDADVGLFRDALRENTITAPIAHASYLINLGSPDDALWTKSMEALAIEWRRSEQLKLDGLVMHPGACMTSTPEEGLSRIAQAVALVLNEVQPKHCRLLFENTAGQGSCLGHSIDQLGWLLRTLDQPNHFGICWDTCHALAAGYDFRTASGMKSMIAELEKQIGLENLRAVHINDSKKDCGSRVDRHEHIGRGCIGEAGFKRFLSSSVFKHLPMYLETAKENDEESGEEWDLINLRTLRRLGAK
jgi:deoxyribonuclease IV